MGLSLRVSVSREELSPPRNGLPDGFPFQFHRDLPPAGNKVPALPVPIYI